MKLPLVTATFFVILTAAQPASAETLLVERVQREPAVQMPQRGATAVDVQARFGAPSERLEPRGGQKRQWPVIQRWAYPEFVVYFEKGRVIDAVAMRSSADEVGPRAAGN